MGLYRGLAMSVACRVDGWFGELELGEDCQPGVMRVSWRQRGGRQGAVRFCTGQRLDGESEGRHGDAIRSHVQQEDIMNRSRRAAKFHDGAAASGSEFLFCVRIYGL